MGNGYYYMLPLHRGRPVDPAAGLLRGIITWSTAGWVDRWLVAARPSALAACVAILGRRAGPVAEGWGLVERARTRIWVRKRPSPQGRRPSPCQHRPVG